MFESSKIHALACRCATLLLGAALLPLASCSPDRRSAESKSHRPGNLTEFIAAMQKAQERVVKAWDTEQRWDVRNNEHRSLFRDFPIYYDWWLQDGGNDMQWFGKGLLTGLKERLDKLEINIGEQPDSAAMVKEGFSRYVEFCTDRRRSRLEGFVKQVPEVVFTKYHVLQPSFFAYTEGASDARNECNYYPGGELSTFRIDDGLWAAERSLLKDSAGVFRDPDVHFDGSHILFSWKKSAKGDDFHLYEMELPSQNVKQLTDGLGYADIEPIYLPDGNILFNSSRCGSSVDCWRVEVSNFYLCDREGRYIRRIGYDQVHTIKPSLLDDGRVIYTRWDYNDRGQMFTQPLFQMNPDGTAQTEYYGANSFFPTTIVHPRQIPGTRKVMGTFIGHHTPQHGKIGVIDPEAGRQETDGVMFVAPVREPRPAPRDNIFAQDVFGQQDDQFQYPYPLSEKEMMVSYSPLGYHTGRPIDFAIYWMNIDGERELLVADPEISCNQSLPLAPRKRPFARVSSVDYTKDTGVYYMQDIYEGEGLKGVEPGTVRKLRIVEIILRHAPVGEAYGEDKGGGGHSATPVGVGNASWDVKRVLGTVDVEPDGSAFFSVPSRRPLYFQALDSANRVVQTMRSWSTLQPGEVQSCVGCHEHKNSVPLAGHPVSMAMAKGIKQIVPEGIGERNFSYIKEVQPIWDAKCVKCHDGVKHPMSLKGDLHVVDNQTKRKFSESYLNLTHARRTTLNESWQGDAHHPEVNWISALSEPTLLPPYYAGSNTSNLIKRLENGHKGVTLTKNELETVALWIDLLVPFISDYKEANNWTQDDMEYYSYYENKAEKARLENEANIKEYLRSL